MVVRTLCPKITDSLTQWQHTVQVSDMADRESPASKSSAGRNELRTFSDIGQFVSNQLANYIQLNYLQNLKTLKSEKQVDQMRQKNMVSPKKKIYQLSPIIPKWLQKSTSKFYSLLKTNHVSKSFENSFTSGRAHLSFSVLCQTAVMVDVQILSSFLSSLTEIPPKINWHLTIFSQTLVNLEKE